MDFGLFSFLVFVFSFYVQTLLFTSPQLFFSNIPLSFVYSISFKESRVNVPVNFILCTCFQCRSEFLLNFH